MRFPFIASFALLMLAACTPANERYCESYGVVGTPEFTKCLNYYNTQEAIFGADRGRCEREADVTYPRSLYDSGKSVYSPGYYVGGKYVGGGSVYVPPDYRHNAEVDLLRMRIIAPCMQAQGWHSPDSWQAGRSAAPRETHNHR